MDYEKMRIAACTVHKAVYIVASIPIVFISVKQRRTKRLSGAGLMLGFGVYHLV